MCFATSKSPREAIDLMEANSDRSANLIRSFKDVAVDRSSDSRRHYHLATYIDEVLSTLRPELKKTRLETVVSIDRTIEVDGFPGAMAQIVTNLVMNSIKHGYAPGAEGKLTFHGTLDDHNWVRLVYSDTGDGVPDELRKTMFDPFVTTKRGKGGSGLGLHILHNIVVGKFGGRVAYRDTEGGGATFDLHFPAAAPGSD
jgi:two-component system NtrC family sensor kinase